MINLRCKSKLNFRIDKEAHLCSENIQCEPIETADYSLLNVQPKVVQSPHGGKQETWSAGTEHVNVHSPSFSNPNFHLQNFEGIMYKAVRQRKKIIILF